TLAQIALFNTGEATLTGHGGEPERIRTVTATPSLGAVLRVPPELGRWFTEDEGAPGGAHVAVLSHGLWLRRFGAAANIIGQSITLEGVATEVVGVMPAGFAFPNPAIDVWTPITLSRATGFGIFTFNGLARLR